MALEREMAIYQEHLTDLLVNEGKFVVISGEEILGSFDTYENALEAGYGRYGLGPFLVKQISAVEPILYFTRDLPLCLPFRTSRFEYLRFTLLPRLTPATRQ